MARLNAAWRRMVERDEGAVVESRDGAVIEEGFKTAKEQQTLNDFTKH